MAMILRTNPWSDSGMSFTLSKIRDSVVANTMAARASLSKSLDQKFATNVLQPGQSAIGNDTFDEPVLQPDQPAPGNDIFDETTPSPKEERIEPAIPIEKKKSLPPDIKLPEKNNTIVTNSNINNPIISTRTNPVVQSSKEYKFGSSAKSSGIDDAISAVQNVQLPEIVSKGAAAMVFANEAGGEDYYSKRASTPGVPNKGGIPLGKSGVTIAGGLDLGQMNLRQFDSDVAPYLNPDDADKLRKTVGLQGYDAMNAISKYGLNDINIPYQDAAPLMLGKRFEKHVENLEKTYPGIDELPEGAKGAIISATWQHGTGIGGFKGMLKTAIKNQDISAIKRIFVGLASKYPQYKNRRQMEIDYLSMN